MHSDVVSKQSVDSRSFLAISISSLIAAAAILASTGAGAATTAAGRAAAERAAMEAQAKEVLGIPDDNEDGSKILIDYGYGPAWRRLKTAAAEVATVAPKAVPVGGTNANVTGVFGSEVAWPIIPIHVVLLPDGRVMSYGSNQKGQQGAELVYDVWNPALGTGTNAHTVLPNGTNTDIFCSGQSVMLSGSVLITGGDLTVNGIRNSANNDSTIFTPSTNTLSANTPMNYARWYSTLVSLPNGQLTVFGGRQNVGITHEAGGTDAQPALVPERYDPSSATWTQLTGAASSAAFTQWYYPRAFVQPGGNVFVINQTNGTLYSVNTSGTGSISAYTQKAAPGGVNLPAVSYAPGKVITIRANAKIDTIDFTGATPLVKFEGYMDQVRFFASGVVMANGEVLITGGSTVSNKLTGVAYTAQIWNPATGVWTAGANAAVPRLYHSNSLLLPDGTVWTGGGGAPGPLKNLNAEIYYPPYLYTAGGQPATRPVIQAASPLGINPGGTINLTVGPSDSIASLSFIRTGSATHTFNADERFLSLSFKQTGQSLTATLPSDTSILVPGFYMLFAVNTAGVPSVAQIFTVE